ncbi:serine protease; identified by sequence similarity; putative; ORF located using Blastx/Glimmer [hydrothermal vent metagenome]|uniref:Serine protease identified by sequence similarity putative ORF located using Blastx/Glimmer n=1 Tax=hydrothermal vent metagenome TaxID=652676 RepID=A0A1W1BG47_9ZZZZ
MRYIILIFFISLQLIAKDSSEDITKQAIVKIYTVAKVPNYLEPWGSSIRRSSGSGAIISGNRILTNAHVVANNTFIEVQRYGERKLYLAKVLSVSHQADMALLEVEDKRFFEGVEPLELGVLPDIEQKVVVYGFPMGGKTLSATKGIVSRIEHHRYAHSGESFLAIQVDAAVNPGNSGGPALSNGKIVGIAMQGLTKSQNIGYLVPVNMIKHFLIDIEDGKYDGFADLGLTTQKMENPTIKSYYNMDENTTGILVANLAYNTSLQGVVKEGDIITAIDGHNIEDDNTVEFRNHEYTSYHYFTDQHQLGEEIELDIIRDRKPMKIRATLNHVADDLLLVKTTEYDKMPRYFIYGGYVFSPLSRNLLRRSSRNQLTLRYFATQWPKEEKKEVVVLLKVLASNLSRGNYSFSFWPIDRVNGKKFDNFNTFYKMIQEFDGEYIVLEDKDGAKVVINREEALAKQSDILKKYNIEFDKSIDLRGEKRFQSHPKESPHL